MYYQVHSFCSVWCPCMAINVFVQYNSGLFFKIFNLTYSRWISSLPTWLWSLRIFPSLPGSCLTIFYRDASSALLLQLVNQWLNFTYYSRSHVFRYERKNTNPTLVRIELMTSRCAAYLLDHSGDELLYFILWPNVTTVYQSLWPVVIWGRPYLWVAGIFYRNNNNEQHQTPFLT